MGSTSRYGQAVINPSAPEALGICDRCSKLYNLRALRWQMQWMGTSVQNLHLRVCNTCYDIPNEQLRTLILPPDPMPVMDARTEPYTIDEKNFLTLSAIIGKPAMLIAEGEINCALESGLGIVTAFSDVSDMTAALLLGIGLTAPFSDADAMTAALLLGIGLTAPFSDAGAMTADLDVVTPAGVTRTPTDNFTFSAASTFTETGASIGSAAADRLVFVAVSGTISANNAITSVTIGGVSAAPAAQVRRANGLGTHALSEIWWAAVPTGTTGDVVFTYTGTVNGGCEVYSVTGAHATPIASSDTDSIASGDPSIDLTIGNTTAVIATASLGVNNGDPTVTWTNATEDFEFFNVLVATTGLSGSAASRQDAVGPGATTITATVSASGTDANKVMAGVVIQPA